jgi:hypothetical protein
VPDVGLDLSGQAAALGREPLLDADEPVDAEQPAEQGAALVGVRPQKAAKSPCGSSTTLVNCS